MAKWKKKSTHEQGNEEPKEEDVGLIENCNHVKGNIRALYLYLLSGIDKQDLKGTISLVCSNDSYHLSFRCLNDAAKVRWLDQSQRFKQLKGMVAVYQQGKAEASLQKKGFVCSMEEYQDRMQVELAPGVLSKSMSVFYFKLTLEPIEEHDHEATSRMLDSHSAITSKPDRLLYKSSSPSGEAVARIPRRSYSPQNAGTNHAQRKRNQSIPGIYTKSAGRSHTN